MASPIGGVYQYSFVLSGLVGVGKTSIFNYIKQSAEKNGDLVDFSNNGGSLDCCIYSTTVKGVRCEISLFDTGGLERYASLTSNYYHRCNAVILVYLDDSDRLDTLTCLNMSIESALSYNKFPDQLVFTLWGNEHKNFTSSISDCSESLKQHIEAFLENASIPSHLHFNINPRTGKGIIEAMDSLVWAVHSKCINTGGAYVTPICDDSDSDHVISSNNGKGTVGLLELEDPVTPVSSGKRRKCCN